MKKEEGVEKNWIDMLQKRFFKSPCEVAGKSFEFFIINHNCFFIYKQPGSTERK